MHSGQLTESRQYVCFAATGSSTVVLEMIE